jgi:hypothetical protein
MKRQTLLAALALVCLGSSAADSPRPIDLLQLAQKPAGCKYEGEDFEVGARVCRGGQFWDCGSNGDWTNTAIKCNKKR